MKKLTLFLAVLTLPILGAAQDVYDGCPLIGTATRPLEIGLNPLKNRYLPPTDLSPGDINRQISLADFYSNSSHKWRNPFEAAVIEGWVDDVKVGGIESCNCKAWDPAHRDTHINLVLDPRDYGNDRRHVIVEVTPRWRAIMARASYEHYAVDWSTAALQKTLIHHFVRFTGWIFYDQEHEPQSESTNPGGATNWRATPAEIHPVTKIEILK